MKSVTVLFLSLILFSSLALVNADLFSFERQNPVVTYTESTDESCFGNVCTLVMYSGTRNIYEDGEWKRVENARSLKGSSIKCDVEFDGTHEAVCLDYNFTHKKIMFYTEDSFSLNKNIPVKNYVGGTLSTSRDLRFSDKESARVLTIPSNIDDVVHFGASSTTVYLNDTSNNLLADTHIDEELPDSNFWNDGLMEMQNRTSDTKEFMIKYNIGSLPVGATVTNASVHFHINSNSYDTSGEGFNISVNHLYNKTWKETDWTWNTHFNESEWNSTSTDTLKIFGGTGEPINWQSMNVKGSVIQEYNGDQNNLSLYFRSHDAFGSPSTTDKLQINSRDHASNRPYLNITYVVAQCDYGSGNWNINVYCEYNNTVINIDGNLSINDGGTLNLTNVTLNFNSSNQYIIFDNVANQNKLILNEYSGINDG